MQNKFGLTNAEFFKYMQLKSVIQNLHYNLHYLGEQSNLEEIKFVSETYNKLTSLQSPAEIMFCGLFVTISKTFLEPRFKEDLY